MRVITRDEYIPILEHPEFRWAYGEESPKPWLFEASDLEVNFNFEENSRRRKDDLDWLCEDLAEIFKDYKVAYLNIVEPELFTEQGIALAESIRRGHNENRPLVDAPVHIFTNEESNLLWGFFFLVVQMSWSFNLYFPNYTASIGYSLPADYYFITWKNQELYDKAKNILKDFHPEVYRKPE
ncbi:MAG: hypothetical protein M3Q99_16735 [Acidobacteriota bacterium]|nr:hypothetical protein [Acidobacteriota bacterium]